MAGSVVGQSRSQGKKTFCFPKAPANEEYGRNHSFWAICAYRRHSENTMKGQIQEENSPQGQYCQEDGSRKTETLL